MDCPIIRPGYELCALWRVEDRSDSTGVPLSSLGSFSLSSASYARNTPYIDPDRVYFSSGEYTTESTSATPLPENLCNIVPSHTSHTRNVPLFVPDTILELSRENANERISDQLISGGYLVSLLSTFLMVIPL